MRAARGLGKAGPLLVAQAAESRKGVPWGWEGPEMGSGVLLGAQADLH